MGHSGASKHDRMCFVEHDASPGELGLGLGLGLGLLKEKQKSELRVSRRYIEVERERDSFRSG